MTKEQRKELDKYGGHLETNYGKNGKLYVLRRGVTGLGCGRTINLLLRDLKLRKSETQ